MKHFLGPALGLLMISCAASAADLGMEAPPLKIAQWMKGGPVDLAAGRGKQIHVVEFWATWCSPCRESIPHLTALQQRFKNRGLVVVGISNEKAEEVKPFLARMGTNMNYVVALDDREMTTTNYLHAFEIEGLPHAFVIDKEGRVAWQGHPMVGLEEVIEDIVEDRYDIGAAKRAFAAEKTMAEYFGRATETTNSVELLNFGNQILEDGAGSPTLLNEFAWTILTHPRLKHRDIPLATRAARLAMDKTEGKVATIMDTYARALFESGKMKEAVEIQQKAISVATDPVEREELEKTLHLYQPATR